MSGTDSDSAEDAAGNPPVSPPVHTPLQTLRSMESIASAPSDPADTPVQTPQFERPHARFDSMATDEATPQIARPHYLLSSPSLHYLHEYQEESLRKLSTCCAVCCCILECAVVCQGFVHHCVVTGCMYERWNRAPSILPAQGCLSARVGCMHAGVTRYPQPCTAGCHCVAGHHLASHAADRHVQLGERCHYGSALKVRILLLC